MDDRRRRARHVIMSVTYLERESSSEIPSDYLSGVVRNALQDAGVEPQRAITINSNYDLNAVLTVSDEWMSVEDRDKFNSLYPTLGYALEMLVSTMKGSKHGLRSTSDSVEIESNRGNDGKD